MGRLEGKNAIVTGAAGGIGLQASILMAKEGANVLLVDISKPALDKAIGQLHEHVPNASAVKLEPFVCDVSNEENVKATVEYVDAWGGVDVMFNNAGIMHADDADAVGTPEKVWDLTHNINVKGVWFGSKHAVLSLRRHNKKKGSIINTASVVGLVGSATPQLAYTASKGAVLAMTRELAIVHAREGVSDGLKDAKPYELTINPGFRFNSLCPAPLNTPLLQDWLGDDNAKRHRREVHFPTGRFGEAIEQAQAVVFLASDESSFVNATDFVVDGGMTKCKLADSKRSTIWCWPKPHLPDKRHAPGNALSSIHPLCPSSLRLGAEQLASLGAAEVEGSTYTMSLLSRSLARITTRRLRQQTLHLTGRSPLTVAPLKAPLRATPSTAARFSTVSAMQRASPLSIEGSAQQYDSEIKDITEYIHNYKIDSDLAYDTARFVFLDTLGCGLEALRFKECTKLLGPTVEGTVVPHGTRVPGTNYQLDPINGAFNIGAMIRWLDYNDCWLAAEWGHPSDNLGGILAVADWMSRTNRAGGKIGNGKVLKVKDVLEGMIKAHEIQGCLALENSYNKVGLDHVVLVKVATAAVVSKMLGLSQVQTADAVTQAWVDGQSLRTYRHAPNTMSRKSWAAGDACQRAVNLVLKVQRGEQGVPTVLSAPVWGFYDILFKGKPFEFQRPYGSYVMENILFKVSYPAEFHSQTAIEAAKKIHATLKTQGKSAEDIKDIVIRTHEACVRIIDKQFKPMTNFADRDHCIQYMVATMLVFNRLEATDYTDGGEAATSPLVESLRSRISCVEDPQFTRDYHDPSLRCIPNALTVTLRDGTTLPEVVVDAPLGHRLRREEAKPEILAKYKRHLEGRFGKGGEEEKRVRQLVELGVDHDRLMEMDVDHYVDLYVKE